jgi:TolB-like protein
VRDEDTGAAGEEGTEATGGAAPNARRPRNRPWAALPILLLLAVVAVWSATWWSATRWSATRSAVSVEPAVRLGIMPFAAPATAGVESDTRRIADHLVAELGRADPRRLGVVGPRTTAAYDGSATALRRLADDYRLDFVVNGRFLETADGPVLLAELIRLQDGVHLWVQRFSPLDDPEAIAATIAAAVGSRLELETRTVEPAKPSPAGG